MIQDNTGSLFTGLGGGLDFKITYDVSSFGSDNDTMGMDTADKAWRS